MTLMKVSQSEEHITAFGDHMEKNYIIFSAKRQSLKPFPGSRCVYCATCPARPLKKKAQNECYHNFLSPQNTVTF
jgi:hypothetical protein